MLTKDELDFIDYWEKNRLNRKRSLRQFTIGIPLGVLIITGLFISIISGWHKRAAMVLRANSSLIIMILVASVAIVVFITIFSIKHQWEQKEQQYRELLHKKELGQQSNISN